VSQLRAGFVGCGSASALPHSCHCAAIESQAYPITGTQWHPEKNPFEWLRTPAGERVPHSANAVRFSQAVANFLVGEARLSCHAPAGEEAEDAMMIYNYQPLFTGRAAEDATQRIHFTQTYIFPRWGQGQEGASERGEVQGLKKGIASVK